MAAGGLVYWRSGFFLTLRPIRVQDCFRSTSSEIGDTAILLRQSAATVVLLYCLPSIFEIYCKQFQRCGSWKGKRERRERKRARLAKYTAYAPLDCEWISSITLKWPHGARSFFFFFLNLLFLLLIGKKKIQDSKKELNKQRSQCITTSMATTYGYRPDNTNMTTLAATKRRKGRRL